MNEKSWTSRRKLFPRRSFIRQEAINCKSNWRSTNLLFSWLSIQTSIPSRYSRNDVVRASVRKHPYSRSHLPQALHRIDAQECQLLLTLSIQSAQCNLWRKQFDRQTGYPLSISDHQTENDALIMAICNRPFTRCNSCNAHLSSSMVCPVETTNICGFEEAIITTRKVCISFIEEQCYCGAIKVKIRGALSSSAVCRRTFPPYSLITLCWRPCFISW